MMKLKRTVDGERQRVRFKEIIMVFDFIRPKMKRSKPGCFWWSIHSEGRKYITMQWKSVLSSSDLFKLIRSGPNNIKILQFNANAVAATKILRQAKTSYLTLSGTISVVMYSRCGIIGNNFIICYVSRFSISGFFNRSSQCGNLSVTLGNFRPRAGGHRKAPFSRRTLRSYPRQAASNTNKLSTHTEILAALAPDPNFLGPDFL